ncbi:uncharacterized protein TNIN_156451 [Trichonephila inaurata madagascariensis]|uniref:Gustatory receptor n=1 Tax=Trichonephila inaurata madagascariensis TaxID=2747483 RepID=A0A8X7CNT7_9ARAC|nr:uncharacterized protein TNIN_156451 [Trichonephila inaurata madagascariensis]
MEKIFLPLMILFHVQGLETLPLTELCQKWELFTLAYNSPKYLFNFVLFYSTMVQIAWIILSDEAKRETALLLTFILQMSAHISLYRSRRHIKSLLKQISGLFTILETNCNMRGLKITIFIYCICLSSIASTYGTIYLKSIMTINAHHVINNSSYIAEDFKEYFTFILDVKIVSTAFVLCSLNASFGGYYSFACCCVKFLFTKFISRSKFLIVRGDYHTIFRIYDKLIEMIIRMDNFLAYAAFINVLGNLAGIFYTLYALIVLSEDDYLCYIYFLGAVTCYSLWLLMIMLSASAANQAAKEAKASIMSIPGWFPQHSKQLKMLVRKKYKHKEFSLTLWKIYVVKKSMLLSALGTLVTYGMIVGTLGTVQISENIVKNTTTA